MRILGLWLNDLFFFFLSLFRNRLASSVKRINGPANSAKSIRENVGTTHIYCSVQYTPYRVQILLYGAKGCGSWPNVDTSWDIERSDMFDRPSCETAQAPSVNWRVRSFCHSFLTYSMPFAVEDLRQFHQFHPAILLIRTQVGSDGTSRSLKRADWVICLWLMQSA